MLSIDARWTDRGYPRRLGGTLSAQIAGVNGRLDRVETDVRALDARLRNVEVSFGKVELPLETLERVIRPSADPALQLVRPTGAKAP